MKTFVVLTLAACVAGAAYARPVVIEERGTIQFPDPTFFVADVGIDGDEAILFGTKTVPDVDGNPDIVTRAYLFRRSGSAWNPAGLLFENVNDNELEPRPREGMAMRDGVAVFALSPLRVFERVGSSWLEVPIRSASGGAAGVDPPSDSVEISNGRIFHGGVSFGGVVYERNATAWRAVQALNGDVSGDGDGAEGAQVALAGNRAAVLSPHNNELLPFPSIQIFSRGSTPASWTQEDRINAATGHIFARLALRGDELFVAGLPRHGIARYRRDSGTWTEEGRLTTAGDYVAIREYGVLHGPIVDSDRYVLHLAWDYERIGHVVQVFQPTPTGGWRHAATLAPKFSETLFEGVAVSGRRVLAASYGQTYYFELPETLVTPAIQQDTFTSSDGASWTQTAGSQFEVVRAGYSRVFRQSSLAGQAVAVRDMSNWTNQSIQADVTLRQVNGQDRWAGLATRRSDAANYYYLTLRSTGAVDLKRMRGGVFSTIARGSVPPPFALNRTYRLRLESVGTRLNMYIDGRLHFSTDELEAPLPPGRAALMTYRAAADFDNVVISPTLTTTIYTQSGREQNLEPWTYRGGVWRWVDDGEEEEEGEGNTEVGVFQQQLVTGDARAFVGAHTEDADQIVQSRVRVDAFDTGNGDPWVGLMSRAADPNNYTYLSLRRSGTLTLRKLVNGQIQALGTANVGVTPGAWVQLRLETVGVRVRAYVNGTLVLQADDPDFRTGRTGLLTYRARASFDDYMAVRP